MKKIIKKIVPEFVFSFYHWLWAFGSALFYAFPSKNMVVIGITGTKGKSTSVFMLAKVLEEAGFPVAVSSSLMFKIKEKEWINPYHMTMVGRHRLQKFISDAKKAECKYLIVEVTSEGIKQHRHKFIDFDIACFTNLSEEHIEAHGGFENYKKTKGKLFASLEKSKKKKFDGKNIEKSIVVNSDDENSDYFLNFWADKKYSFGKKDENFKISDIFLDKQNSKFKLQGKEFVLNIPGEFNIYNASLVVLISKILGVKTEVIKKGLNNIKEIPGRAKYIRLGQDFDAVVDLAHTPESFKAIFEMIKNTKKKNGRIISLFGAAGGGRDKWKRPELGRIAAKYSDIIFLTNEDPYDENPLNIIDEIKKGVKDSGFLGELHIIKERQKAIQTALNIAKKDDVVLFLGKGTEKTMVLGDKIVNWNEEKEVKDAIKNKLFLGDEK